MAGWGVNRCRCRYVGARSTSILLLYCCYALLQLVAVGGSLSAPDKQLIQACALSSALPREIAPVRIRRLDVIDGSAAAHYVGNGRGGLTEVLSLAPWGSAINLEYVDNVHLSWSAVEPRVRMAFWSHPRMGGASPRARTVPGFYDISNPDKVELKTPWMLISLRGHFGYALAVEC
jgi:hypothetical protein